MWRSLVGVPEERGQAEAERYWRRWLRPDLRPAPQSRPAEQPRSDVPQSSHFGPPTAPPWRPPAKERQGGVQMFYYL